jgi:hypothetical protein
MVFSVATALLTLASPSQSVIHTALMCLTLFAAGVGLMCFQRRFAESWRVAWSLVICGGIAFGLAGAAILPMYIGTGEMIRHVGAHAAVIGHAQIPWKSFNLSQLTLSQAPGIVVRPTWIAIVGSPYVGPLGLVGVLLTGIYFRRLDPFLRMLAMVFGVIGLYGLLSGFGTNLGCAYVNFHLPFINRIREAGRHLVLFVIGVSFLSGLGYRLVARNLEQYKQSRNARQFIPSAVLMLIFAMIILWELSQNSNERRPTQFCVVALAPTLFILGRVWRLSGYQNIVSAAVLVSAAAVAIPVRGFSISESDFDKPINLLSHRVIQSFADKIDTAGYRVDFRDNAFSNRFWAMNASYYGVKSFYNQLTPQLYDQFRFGNLINVPHLRAMMGARYVLCGPTDSPTDGDAKEILGAEGYRLYENSKPMGRITLVHRVAGATDNEREFIGIIRKGFDYFSEAYADREHLEAAERFLGSSQILPHPRDRITRVVDQTNRSYSAVESDSASLLVLNEWFTPAWKARVNGKNQPVLRVNEWQTGVLLGAGKNRVELEYHPTLFFVLMRFNRITIGLLLLFALFALVRRLSGNLPRFRKISG